MHSVTSSTDRIGANPFVASPGAAGGADEEGLDLRLYWRIFKQNKWRIFSYGFLFALVGLLIALRSTPIYKADVKLLAEPMESKVTSTAQWASTALVWLFYETQKEILLSRNVALQVVDQLNLVAYNDERARKAEQNRVKLFDLDWRLWLPEQWRGETVSDQPPPTELEKRQDVADSLIGSLQVEIGKESQIINVAFEHDDPLMAAAVANAVATTYRDFGLASQLNKAREQTVFLNDQLGDLKTKVQQAENQLQAYQEREGLIDTESRQKIVTAQLAGFSQQLVEAEGKRSEAEIRYREVQRLQQEKGSYDSIAAVLQSNLISRLREKQSELSGRVSELSERYGEKHPKMISARTELRDATRVLAQSVEKVVGGLKQEYLVALQQERKLNALMEGRKSDIQGLQSKGFELSKLEREVENARQVYEQFLSRLNELDVTGDYDVSNVSVIDVAEVPKRPFKPHKVRIVLGAGFLGLLFGAFVAFMRDRMDTSFKLLEHAEQRLRVTGLGIVPFMRPKDLDSPIERVSETNPHSPFAESINHIRTGILFSNIDHPPQVIMVTSSTASEGKTTFISNLAYSFSQMGRTLLVECDLRKPRIAGFYGLAAGGGLTNLAMQPDRAQELIRRIDEQGDLYVLPAGSQLPNPLEFLSSESFAKLLAAFRKKFDYILLDAPPILPVSDAIVLSHVTDGVVLAVRADVTNEKMAREAVKRLRAAHIEPLGVALTLASTKRMAEYGGHYYSDQSYYGYGRGNAYGYGHLPQEKAPVDPAA